MGMFEFEEMLKTHLNPLLNKSERFDLEKEQE